LRALTLVGAARAAGAPVVTHIHAYDLHESLASGSTRYAAVLARLGRWSARVVVLHNGVADDLRDVAPDSSVVVLPNCVDCERYRPVETPEGTPRVVFVGTAGRRKGGAVLVDALGRVRHPVVGDIAGGPAEEEQEAYDELRRAGASLVAAGHLEFHGEVDRERSLALLQRASLFVLPSFAEGMPVALLEAMACGVAVIVTDVGAMGDIVRQAACGLVVPPGDANALAEAIDALLADDHRRALMGAAGRNAILERHCCDAVGDTLAAVYKAVSR
jgi:glycosyltransferase involved in cell wall biosynthesis